MFEPSHRKRARRPALETLEGRVLLSDTVSINSAGVVTITGSSSAAAQNTSNILVQWTAANAGKPDVYFITEQNPNVTFTAPTGTGPAGVVVLQNPSNAGAIQIQKLATFFANGGTGAAININNGVGMGATISVASSGPGVPITVADNNGVTNGGTVANVTIGSSGQTGLALINGPVTVSNRNGAQTNLTIDDTGDQLENPGFQVTPMGFTTTQPVVNPNQLNFTVNYQNALLSTLTFNSTGANTMGSAVTINDNGIALPSNGLATTVNDNSGKDNITVVSTPGGNSSLAINGQSGEMVTLGTVSNGTTQIAGNNVTLTGAVGLTVGDAGDTMGVIATISSTAIVGLAPANIDYGTALSSLAIYGGSGGNTFTVMSLPSLPVPTPTILSLGTNTVTSIVNTVTVFATALSNAALNLAGASPADVLNLDASMMPGLTVAPIAGSNSRVLFTPAAMNGGLAAQVGTVNITKPAPQTTPGSINATQGVPATPNVADFVLPVAPVSPVSLISPIASINWGDGSAATIGSVVEDSAAFGLFRVKGTHTFNAATAANTPDSVVATINGNAGFILNGVTINEIVTPLALPAAVATVAAPGPGGGGGTNAQGPNFVKGALSPASDSGTSNSDLITNNPTPVFLGTTNPGAKVTLFVQGLKSFTSPTPVGTAVADGNGNWTITSFAVPADSYQFTVQSVDSNGSTATAALTTTARPLVVDLAGPVIQSATLSAKARQVVVVFMDAMGLNVATLANPAAYAVSGKGVSRITTLNVSGSGTTVTVALTFAARKSFAGTLTFLVRAGNVANIAGNPLDGKFAGRFPSGNGVPGGNFLATLPIKSAKKRSGGGVTIIVHP